MSQYWIPPEKQLYKWLINVGFSKRAVHNLSIKTQWIFYRKYLEWYSKGDVTAEKRISFIKGLENV